MHVVIALLVVTVGSVLFHLYSPWWSTPIASNWSYIDDTITLTFWITGVVFMAIMVFMIYCILKFKHREGLVADYEPENSRLEWALTILTIGIFRVNAERVIAGNIFDACYAKFSVFPRIAVSPLPLCANDFDL